MYNIESQSKDLNKQLAYDYVEFERKNRVAFFDEKVDREMKLKKIKKYSSILNLCLFAFAFYLYISFNSLIFPTYVLILIFANIQYLRYRKKHTSQIEKALTAKEVENIIKESFLESYASKNLIEIYKKEKSKEEYDYFLISKGSNEDKIKIKFLLE